MSGRTVFILLLVTCVLAGSSVFAAKGDPTDEEVARMVAAASKVTAVKPEEALGVNSRDQLLDSFDFFDINCEVLDIAASYH